MKIKTRPEFKMCGCIHLLWEVHCGGDSLLDKYFGVTVTTLGTGDAEVGTKQSSEPYRAAILMLTVIFSEGWMPSLWIFPPTY